MTKHEAYILSLYEVQSLENPNIVEMLEDMFSGEQASNYEESPFWKNSL